MNKLLLIIFTIVLFLLLAIFGFWLLTRPIQNITKTNINPSITLVPTPTPNPTDLFISEILPPQNTKEPYLTFQKITINFSEEIDPIALKYEITPKTEVLVSGDLAKKTVYIIPRTTWEIGKTTITILQSTRSRNGKALYRPFTYSIITDIPKASEDEGKLP
jgi:hypothetical protein